MEMPFNPKLQPIKSQQSLDQFLKEYYPNVPEDVFIHLDPSSNSQNDYPIFVGATRPAIKFHPMYIALGIKFPLSKLQRDFFSHFGLAPSQYNPTTYRFLLSFERLNEFYQLGLGLNEFRAMYEVKYNGPSARFYLSFVATAHFPDKFIAIPKSIYDNNFSKDVLIVSGNWEAPGGENDHLRVPTTFKEKGVGDYGTLERLNKVERFRMDLIKKAYLVVRPEHRKCSWILHPARLLQGGLKDVRLSGGLVGDTAPQYCTRVEHIIREIIETPTRKRKVMVIENAMVPPLQSHSVFSNHQNAIRTTRGTKNAEEKGNLIGSPPISPVNLQESGDSLEPTPASMVSEEQRALPLGASSHLGLGGGGQGAEHCGSPSLNAATSHTCFDSDSQTFPITMDESGNDNTPVAEIVSMENCDLSTLENTTNDYLRTLSTGPRALGCYIEKLKSVNKQKEAELVAVADQIQKLKGEVDSKKAVEKKLAAALNQIQQLTGELDSEKAYEKELLDDCLKKESRIGELEEAARKQSEEMGSKDTRIKGLELALHHMEEERESLVSNIRKVLDQPCNKKFDVLGNEAAAKL